MARTKNALTILNTITGNNTSVRKGIADARINLEIAQMVYAARVGAGLSQRQLADLIGSKQPVIARLEDADYEGHSLTMLQRIAEALQRRLEVRFVPPSKRRASKATLRAPRRRKLNARESADVPAPTNAIRGAGGSATASRSRPPPVRGQHNRRRPSAGGPSRCSSSKRPCAAFSDR